MTLSRWTITALWRFGYRRLTRIAVMVAISAVFAAPPPAALAQAPDGVSIPSRWQGRGDLPRPNLSGIETLRIVTDGDYPPFNYRDGAGTLTGFNVDLARALCDELSLRCIIDTLDWDKQLTALEKGKVDAVIASRKITAANRRKILFTDKYYRTPARFAVRQDTKLADISPEGLRGKSIAVRRGTAHEAYLRQFFKNSRIRSFTSHALAREALSEGAVDALFGDAVSLMFWIAGTSSQACCRFAGGPYTETKFFGDGVGIAVRKNNTKLARILNYGLERLRQRGIYRDLFLRYFPAGNF